MCDDSTTGQCSGAATRSNLVKLVLVIRSPVGALRLSFLPPFLLHSFIPSFIIASLRRAFLRPSSFLIPSTNHSFLFPSFVHSPVVSFTPSFVIPCIPSFLPSCPIPCSPICHSSSFIIPSPFIHSIIHSSSIPLSVVLSLHPSFIMSFCQPCIPSSFLYSIRIPTVLHSFIPDSLFASLITPTPLPSSSSRPTRRKTRGRRWAATTSGTGG